MTTARPLSEQREREHHPSLESPHAPTTDQGFVPGRRVSWWSPPHVPHLPPCLAQSSGGFVSGPTRDIGHWCCNPCPSVIRVPSHSLGTGLTAGRSGSFVVPLDTPTGRAAVSTSWVTPMTTPCHQVGVAGSPDSLTRTNPAKHQSRWSS